MNGSYEIYLGNEVVGEAHVRREGLYYHFRCRCDLSGDVICRVTVSCGGHHENLGILVPTGDGFTLKRKIPVKKIASGKPEFRVLPRHQKTRTHFMPVYPDEPFRYLARLQDAFLEVREGQVGISVMEANL